MEMSFRNNLKIIYITVVLNKLAPCVFNFLCILSDGSIPYRALKLPLSKEPPDPLTCIPGTSREKIAYHNNKRLGICGIKATTWFEISELQKCFLVIKMAC